MTSAEYRDLVEREKILMERNAYRMLTDCGVLIQFTTSATKAEPALGNQQSTTGEPK